MRVAFLSVFYPYRGGIAQFNERLFEELATLHEVEAFNYSLQYPQLLFPGKTQYVEKTDKVWAHQSQRVLNSINPFSWSKTAGRIKKFKPDILLVRLWTPYLAPASAGVIKRVKRNLKETVVVSILDNVVPHEPRFFDRVLLKGFLESCDRFILMSNSVLDELKQFIAEPVYELSPHPINDRFPNTISREESREKLGIKKEEKAVLFFGFIRAYKGLDILIKSVNKSTQNWKLIIAGECYGSFQVYQDLIENEKIENRVLIFNKYISDEEIQLYFNSSDLCALPYKTATQSGIIPVALHFGLPVITSKAGGLEEYVEHNVNGILLEENNPLALSKEIDLYFSESKRNSLKEGIERSKIRYSWAKFAENITINKG